MYPRESDQVGRCAPGSFTLLYSTLLATNCSLAPCWRLSTDPPPPPCLRPTTHRSCRHHFIGTIRECQWPPPSPGERAQHDSLLRRFPRRAHWARDDAQLPSAEGLARRWRDRLRRLHLLGVTDVTDVTDLTDVTDVTDRLHLLGGSARRGAEAALMPGLSQAATTDRIGRTFLWSRRPSSSCVILAARPPRLTGGSSIASALTEEAITSPYRDPGQSDSRCGAHVTITSIITSNVTIHAMYATGDTRGVCLCL